MQFHDPPLTKSEAETRPVLLTFHDESIIWLEKNAFEDRGVQYAQGAMRPIPGIGDSLIASRPSAPVDRQEASTRAARAA